MTTSKRQVIFSQRQPRIEKVLPSSGNSTFALTLSVPGL